MLYTFIGIDPGKNGAAVALDSLGQFMEAVEFSKSTERDTAQWFAEWKTNKTACIEVVHAMPKQGVSSSFKFGAAYGFLRGVLAATGTPYEEARPQRWQKAMGCLTKGEKNVTKAAAQRLWPNVRVTHAIADAMLIAEFCRRQWKQREGNT